MNLINEMKGKSSYTINSSPIVIFYDTKGKKRIRLRLINNELAEIKSVRCDELNSIGQGKVCDYLIIKEGLSRNVLLELKGDGDKNDAARQILETWSCLKQQFPIDFNCIIAIIVTDRCSTTELNSTEFTRLRRRCIQSNGVLHDVKSNVDFHLN